MSDRARHWDDAYQDEGPEGVSWYQPEPLMSLVLIRLLDVGSSVAVVDVGGGASLLVDRLVESGFGDVTVLDLSEVALEESRRRLKDHPQVTFIHEDVLSWKSSRRFGLWHDRAVFHFLTDERDMRRYLATMSRSLNSDGRVVIGTFAEDGPQYCSGLTVARYSPVELSDLLGREFTVVATRRELHRTPGGANQPFTWIAAKMSRAPGGDS
jgi:SAM-dependent methyltransferase